MDVERIKKAVVDGAREWMDTDMLSTKIGFCVMKLYTLFCSLAETSDCSTARLMKLTAKPARAVDVATRMTIDTREEGALIGEKLQRVFLPFSSNWNCCPSID